ncbi:hypothetical protein TNCV_216091 [Trichonephila clavipes]|nr:hypothetical protein TNCV_216091 [Trichonephila clavipes]
MSFPWVRAVNGRIFKNSSFVEKSSNTILTDIANCAVSTASIDSSSCIEKNSQVSTSFANFASKLLAINSILLVAVLADNCNMLIAPNISVLFLKSLKRESAAIL